MHVVHGNSAAAAGGLFDMDDADLLDGELLEEPEMLELDITVGGQQRLMPLFGLWTDGQAAVSAAVPSWAVDQGLEFEIEAAVSGDGTSLCPEVRR